MRNALLLKSSDPTNGQSRDLWGPWLYLCQSSDLSQLIYLLGNFHFKIGEDKLPGNKEYTRGPQEISRLEKSSHVIIPRKRLLQTLAKTECVTGSKTQETDALFSDLPLFLTLTYISFLPIPSSPLPSLSPLPPVLSYFLSLYTLSDIVEMVLKTSPPIFRNALLFPVKIKIRFFLR